MTTLWKVTYKTFPESGVRHDKEDVFLANGIGKPCRTRSHYDFGNGVRRYGETDVVRVEKLWDVFDDRPPRELVEQYPDVGWLDWVGEGTFPHKCADGTPIKDVLEDAVAVDQCD